MKCIKNFLDSYKDVAINLLLVFLFATYTVNHYSPEFLNADVLINSIMSIQHVTLFYWGQDRILNLLPFLVSGIKNPQENLYFVLLFAAVCHFTLLLLISETASRLSVEQEKHYSTTIFIALSFIFLLIFKEGEIFSIVVWHFEYSAAFLMLLWVALRTLNMEKLNLLDLTFHAALILIATGINYSILILALAMVGSVWLYKKSINKPWVNFLWLSIFSFVLWGFISKKYGVGGNNYTKFNFGELNLSLPMVVDGILQTFKPLQISLLLITFSAFRLFYKKQFDIKLADKYKRNAFILICILGFCLGWLILFSASNWIKVSQYHYRYFTVIFYCLLFYFTYFLAQGVALINRPVRLSIVLFTLAFLPLQAAKDFTPFNEFAVFKTLETYPSSQYRLFAGDYWTAWPAVLNKTFNGEESYGLAFRAEGNKVNVNRYVTRVNKSDGNFKVLCMNEKVSVCSKQVNSTLGANLIEEVKAIADNSSGMIVSLNNVEPMQLSESHEVLSTEELSRIKLTLKSKIDFQDSVFFTINIQNNTPKKIAAYSKLANPVRVAWHIADAYNHPKTDFAPRLELPSDISANESLNIQVMVEKNKLRAGDHIKFSLVQESLFLPHDLGINPLTVDY